MSSKINRGRQKQNRARTQHERPRRMADDDAQLQADAAMKVEVERLEGIRDRLRTENLATMQRLQAQGIGVMAQGLDVRSLAKMVSGNNPVFLAQFDVQVEVDMRDMLAQGDTPETQEALRKARLTEGVGPVTPEMERALRDEHGGVILNPNANGEGLRSVQ